MDKKRITIKKDTLIDYAVDLDGQHFIWITKLRRREPWRVYYVGEPLDNGSVFWSFKEAKKEALRLTMAFAKKYPIGQWNIVHVKS